MKTKYRYIEELNYFNAVACLLVILIHVLAIGVDGFDPLSWQQFAAYLPWRLAAFVVPAFLFSGAVKMAVQFVCSDEAAPYGRYIAERCRTILLPYIVFCVVYFIVLSGFHYMDGSLKTLGIGLIAGNLSGQFYYVVIVMQFYLLMPLWRKILFSVPWYLALACAAFLTYAAGKGAAALKVFHVSFPYLDRVFLPYLFFWILGLYAGKYYERLYESLYRNRMAVWASGIFVAVSAVVVWLQLSYREFIFEMDYFKLIVDSLSILILLTACIALGKRKSPLTGLLNRINRASYFVYLSHCLFITLVTFRLQEAGVWRIDLLLAVRVAVGYTIPFLLYYLYDRCRARILPFDGLI